MTSPPHNYVVISTPTTTISIIINDIVIVEIVFMIVVIRLIITITITFSIIIVIVTLYTHHHIHYHRHDLHRQSSYHHKSNVIRTVIIPTITICINICGSPRARLPIIVIISLAESTSIA